MSSYTTEVRYICESTAGLTDSADFNSIDNVLSKETVDKIFNFDYPIFDETYRYPLNKKILRHFYTREIGEETVGLWKLRLQQTLNEVMPYYNQLYKLELDKINPFYSVDLTTTRHTTGNERTDETNSLNKTITGNTNTTKNEQSNNSKTENANENKTGDKTRFIDEGHNDTTKTDTGTNKTINSNENSNTNKTKLILITEQKMLVTISVKIKHLLKVSKVQVEKLLIAMRKQQKWELITKIVRKIHRIKDKKMTRTRANGGTTELKMLQAQTIILIIVQTDIPTLRRAV